MNSKRIVAVSFEGGLTSLGSKIRFGHFWNYAVVSINPAISEMLGHVIEVEARNESGTVGFFMIPIDKIEGIEYCHDTDLSSVMENFRLFTEEVEKRRRPAAGPSGPLESMPNELQEFITRLAQSNGVELPENMSNPESEEDRDDG